MTPNQRNRAMKALYGDSTEPIKTPRKKPVQYESKIQANCVKWFNLQYPELYFSLFAVPNGSSRNAIEGGRLKREGVTAGISDLVLAYRGRTAFIEVKTSTGRQSDSQKEFQAHIESHGFTYHIVTTLDEFQELINGICE